MDAIGIFHHPRISQSQPLADEICRWLSAQQVAAQSVSVFDQTAVKELLPDLSMLVVLGGDGSILRAARLTNDRTVPIFGINLGRVGFLSEAQPDDWPEKLASVLSGDYWIEERLMLHGALHRRGRLLNRFTALNDIVVGRGKQARVVQFQLRVDEDLVTNYTADALIVATPTGSTAYAMAAGGPLLPPQLQNFVVLPVAPHLSFDRALVLHETAEISIEVKMDHDAYMTPDGQHGISLQSGDQVAIRKHDRRCHFVRVENPGYFYRRLMGRLGYVR